MNDNANRKLWVDALRSGDYRQGRGLLHRIDNATGQTYMCCLGVLTDVYIKETGAQSWTDPHSGIMAVSNGNAYSPTLEVVEWVGLKQAHVRLLANMNDVEGWTFDMIAAWIEEQ